MTFAITCVQNDINASIQINKQTNKQTNKATNILTKAYRVSNMTEHSITLNPIYQRFISHNIY